MNGLKKWWKELWVEEYDLVIRVADTVHVQNDGTRIETWKEQKYKAKQLIKTTHKHFIFVDLEGHKIDIRFVNPVDFYIVKIY